MGRSMRKVSNPKSRIFIAIKTRWLFYFLAVFSVGFLEAENFPDQFYVLQGGDSIWAKVESNSGLELSADGKHIQLQDGINQGYVILQPFQAQYPFNRGLPSWNGTAADQDNGFLIQIRFSYQNSWSPWLTAGYWKEDNWISYGQTSYDGGKIDIDYVKLNDYQERWQFRINMKRASADAPSPTIHKLSFFVSDTRTTKSMDYSKILNDDPDEIFIPTTFICQYDVDDNIGGSICSPTSVSMILLSYGIDVDPLQFAQDTYDSHFDIFGIWPRVVQNASEYGLDGAVTRYRNWSQARQVLANGGRIAMSVGPPLFSGHLMMLAGFDKNGDPLVHNPGSHNGYAYHFDKGDLSHSWFDKGGIAYTFYPADSQTVAIGEPQALPSIPVQFHLFQNYPNPFNTDTRIRFLIPYSALVRIGLFDMNGRFLQTIFEGQVDAGSHSFIWHASHMPTGTYFIRMRAKGYQQVIKAVLLK